MNFQKTEWRLIHTPAAEGAWNMAVDEAILEAVGNGHAKSTLRLYAWSPPCLSIGYAQAVQEVDFDGLRDHGWQLVRRPTGGRAILHADELTYSVIAPHSEPRVSGGVLESYRRLASALLLALDLLAISAQTLEKETAQNSRGTENPVCFETPSNYEITVEGKKIIGSAQARRRQGVLQHGSFPLYGDLQRIIKALVFPDEESRSQAAQRLTSRATTAEQVLGYKLSWNVAAQRLADAFRGALNLDFVSESLSPGEQARAVELVSEKYNHPEWTNRV